MELPVTFTNEGMKLFGILHQPEGAAPKTGAVLLHGWSSCRMGPHRILVETARRLAAQGVAALRFDHRSRGDSEGEDDDADLDGMISDAATATDLLRERAGVKDLVMIGICSGGNVAIGAATLRQDVSRIVAWSTLPFQPHRPRMLDVKKTGHFAAEYMQKMFRLETWRKIVTGAVNYRMIRKVLFGHYVRTDPEGRNPKDSARDIMADFAKYRGRVRFIYGGADPEAAGAKAHYEAFCREHGIPADYVFVEGANHNYYSLEWKRQVIEKTVEWVVA
jgi:pimeloyl-ACP methyl ester carboxylesterase